METPQITNLKTPSNLGDFPIDLLLEIFVRLPTKSVARSRCVSKKWASMLRLPSFTEVYLTRSSARPRLLFACHDELKNEVLFFTSTQPRIVDENLSHLTVTYQMKIPYHFKFERFSPFRGLVSLRDKEIVEGNEWVSLLKNPSNVMCNPSTGQYLTIPKRKTRTSSGVRNYIGYDPVEKQYKVLSMTWMIHVRGSVFEEHQVMTLGVENPSWRKIECSLSHSPSYKHSQICINGVLYYLALNSPLNLIIVSFDVKSEKFSFINCMETGMLRVDATALINCNGRLGFLVSDLVRWRSTSFELWILENAETKEWSKHIYMLPDLLKNLVRCQDLRVVGVTMANDIVLSRNYRHESHDYIIYYNTERETVKKVEIRGLEGFKISDFYAYLDYVEDVKLMQMF